MAYALEALVAKDGDTNSEGRPVQFLETIEDALETVLEYEEES